MLPMNPTSGLQWEPEVIESEKKGVERGLHENTRLKVGLGPDALLVSNQS